MIIYISFKKKKDEKDKLYFVFIVCLFEKCTRTISMLKKKKNKRLRFYFWMRQVSQNKKKRNKLITVWRLTIANHLY